jgi:hypothetical protein
LTETGEVLAMRYFDKNLKLFECKMCTFVSTDNSKITSLTWSWRLSDFLAALDVYERMEPSLGPTYLAYF